MTRRMTPRVWGGWKADPPRPVVVEVLVEDSGSPAGASAGEQAGVAGVFGGVRQRLFGGGETGAPGEPLVVDADHDRAGREIRPLFGLLFLVCFLCSLDRVALSVAMLPMSQDFGWTDTTKGLVSAASTIGYMVALLPAGIAGSLADPVLVMGVGVAIWSAATLATPAAALSTPGLAPLLAARFVMGAAEAVCTPTIQTFASRYVPLADRAQVLAFTYSGLQAGTIAAYLASPVLMDTALSVPGGGGWPLAFQTYGSLGLVWLGAWLLWQNQHTRPDKPALASPAPATGHADEPVAPDNIPWRRIASSPAVWAATTAHASHAVGLYVLLAWLPTYFQQQFAMETAAASQASWTPFLFGALTANAVGWGFEGLTNLMHRATARKAMQTVALVGPACCLAALATCNDPDQAQGLFTLCVSLGSFSFAGFGSCCQDITLRYTALVYAITSAAGSLAGSGSTFLTGYLLDATSGDWTLSFFYPAMATYIAGAVVFLSLWSDEESLDAV